MLLSVSHIACVPYSCSCVVRRLSLSVSVRFSFFFFFNDTSTTEIYTLSLHDALPIFPPPSTRPFWRRTARPTRTGRRPKDRKSTRLNSSHLGISYAVFCLKKKRRHNA